MLCDYYQYKSLSKTATEVIIRGFIEFCKAFGVDCNSSSFMKDVISANAYSEPEMPDMLCVASVELQNMFDAEECARKEEWGKVLLSKIAIEIAERFLLESSILQQGAKQKSEE